MSRSPERAGALFDRYAVEVWQFLHRRVVDVDVVEELLTELFVDVAGHLDRVPEDDRLPVLYRRAGQLLSVREQLDAAFLPASVRPSTGSVLPSGQLRSDEERLVSAWAALTDSERDVLRLAAWERLSGDRLAAALGVPADMADAALHHARQRLVDLVDLSR